ncbi:site-specific integrase [Hyphomonas sp.]|uniref:tyrosine-type recombinase/integrase n=1 Tax=Hyphomonas sp. TaxID=87 RepID=UPI000C53DB9A|nr:site-specific integrase [Hyphomonas sp.]MAB11995.1 integrase [Hyphomonas sp.]MAU66994.1 integrase [Hyphomonas sp.]MBM57259.1 integrase [Hyphomonas sp.]
MTPDAQPALDTSRTHRISERTVKSLDAPEAGNRIYYDTEIKGFGVRVTAAGQRSFVLNYRIFGRQRRLTIGQHPDWPATAARKRAAELKRMVDVGTDPLELRENANTAPTMRDVFDRYEQDYLPRLAEKTQRDVRRYFRDLILPKIGSKKVSQVTFEDCDAIHRHASKTAPTTANRAIAALRRSLNLAITWGWIDRNPTKGLELNQERKVERFLSIEEIGRLLRALDDHPRKDSAEAIKVMLFTGCRRGEALSAKWDQFDSEFRIWTKPASTTKQRRLHRVPVSAPVTALLKSRRKRVKGDYVFPSHKGDTLKEVRRTWSGVLEEAKIEGVRLHDLRHTFASLAVSQGHSLPIIGAMLGHSQTQTTARYAHLFDDPLIATTESVASIISGSRLKRP